MSTPTPITVTGAELRVLTMRTRLPFRYGITVMTAVPHLFVQLSVCAGGVAATGLAADGLPPKWFTKDPSTSFADDLQDMFAVIRAAVAGALDIREAQSPFQFWLALQRRQAAWARERSYPPLLWGFGVSLVERALLDGFCRARGTTIAAAIREDQLGMRLAAIHPELAGTSPAALLPQRRAARLAIRHTIGLADPLTDADVDAADRVDDGLPQTLEESIRRYGLTHFKIKVSGDRGADLTRLGAIQTVLGDTCAAGFALTLDANEQFTSVTAFQQFWHEIAASPALAPLRRGLLFVEQPFERSVALEPAVTDALHAWRNRPPLIIDESDAELSSVRTALAGGYAGTSFKSCKGVFKGIANACLLAWWRQAQPQRNLIMSAEDLATVGPVALLQDLAVVAALGIDHVERNGHHYFRGLAMLPQPLQNAMLDGHPDLYTRHGLGFPVLAIRGGGIAAGSLARAPFGYGPALDLRSIPPLDGWSAGEFPQ